MRNLRSTRGSPISTPASAPSTAPTPPALSALPGFGPGQTHSLRGQSLDTNGGCGEDEELSVARILWQLQSDPLFASGASSTSWQQVFNAAKGAATRGGFTLYGLWLEITANVTDDNVLDRLARISSRPRMSPPSRTRRTPTRLLRPPAPRSSFGCRW